MLTKGFITSLPEPGNNIYKVRLPIFEQAGITKNRVTTSEFSATLSHDPGNLNAYRVGDCVYVAFEDNDYSNAVIIGLLDLSDKREATTFSLLNSLKVTEAVELPLNTNIGEISFKDILLQLNQIQYKESKLPAPIPGGYLHINEEGKMEWTSISGLNNESSVASSSEIPPCPASLDGVFVLKAFVVDGVVTYRWVETSDSN